MESSISLAEQAEILVLLLLAAFLSALVGMDRERRDKDAGLRTHMLVGVGACLFTVLSRLAFPYADSARVASNIVTGVGFLGAGVIWKGENQVHDLTTAASIWVTAAIGMTVGAGAWMLASAGTVLIWIILAVFAHLPMRDRSYYETADLSE